MVDNEIPIRLKDGVELPLRTSPLRLAVLHKNGLCSNSWTVVTQKSGDAYVVCRDGYSDVKVSLHKSGVNRIAFTSESKMTMTDSNRVWNEWKRPQLEMTNMIVPLFRLIMPDWSLGIPFREIQSMDQKKRIHVFAETGHDGLVTVITFHLIENGTTVNSDGGINYPLGILPVGSDYKLLVVLNRLPETNLRQSMENVLNSISPRAFGMDESHIGKRLGLLASGYNDDGTGFIITMPIDVLSKREGEFAG